MAAAWKASSHSAAIVQEGCKQAHREADRQERRGRERGCKSMPSEASTLLLPSRLPLATSWPLMGLVATKRVCGS